MQVEQEEGKVEVLVLYQFIKVQHKHIDIRTYIFENFIYLFLLLKLHILTRSSNEINKTNTVILKAYLCLSISQESLKWRSNETPQIFLNVLQ